MRDFTLFEFSQGQKAVELAISTTVYFAYFLGDVGTVFNKYRD